MEEAIPKKFENLEKVKYPVPQDEDIDPLYQKALYIANYGIWIRHVWSIYINDDVYDNRNSWSFVSERVNKALKQTEMDSISSLNLFYLKKNYAEAFEVISWMAELLLKTLGTEWLFPKKNHQAIVVYSANAKVPFRRNLQLMVNTVESNKTNETKALTKRNRRSRKAKTTNDAPSSNKNNEIDVDDFKIRNRKGGVQQTRETFAKYLKMMVKKLDNVDDVDYVRQYVFPQKIVDGLVNFKRVQSKMQELLDTKKPYFGTNDDVVEWFNDMIQEYCHFGPYRRKRRS